MKPGQMSGPPTSLLPNPGITSVVAVPANLSPVWNMAEISSWSQAAWGTHNAQICPLPAGEEPRAPDNETRTMCREHKAPELRFDGVFLVSRGDWLAGSRFLISAF